MQTNNRIANSFSLLGLVVFPLVWYVADIYLATAALMGIFVSQILLLLILKKPIEKAVWVMCLLVVVLGALTLLLREKAYIQIKTSIVYAGFAVVLLASQFVFKKNLLQLALQQFFRAEPRLWRNLSLSLAVYFMLLSLCNWIVLNHFSEAVWVSVKTFGFPAATFVFTIGIIICLSHYGEMIDNDTDKKSEQA